jgi:hypothetical protein
MDPRAQAGAREVQGRAQSVRGETHFKTHKARTAQADQETAQNAYWQSFRDFQKAHEDYATPIDIVELNVKVKTWMNRLAYVNGYDLKPGATAEEKARYETAKRQLAFRYARGDKEVLANSEGTPPPEGYEAYVRVANLDKIRKDLINQGILAQNATLQEAWVLHYSGTAMEEDVREMEAAAAAKGGKDAVKALETHQSDHARNLPNDLPAGQAPAAGKEGEFSPEQIKDLLSMTPEDMRRSPEKAKKRADLMKTIGAGMT